MDKFTTGDFTLPGEAGYEKLTLQLAEKWGADVIRDSDGTALSDEIINAGYGICSTICMIRDHNAWAKENPDKLQQTFLVTEPLMAEGKELTVNLTADFFEEQFKVNDSEEAFVFWQVYDRLTNQEIPRSDWSYSPCTKQVTIKAAVPFHNYTVSFLAYRIWEEISMYNHLTNHWDQEHLMPVDPWSEEAQEYLYGWLEHWCETHPAATIVRFTSMFYNFVWIWGGDERRRHVFTDWASYDFTVSPGALNAFEQQYGYALTAEDFVNQGKFHVTHMPPVKRQLDYMDFICSFVLEYGKKLVDLVHRYNKKAYVFYDDSWVGIEPYGRRFQEFGFDGLIKCVFSGYEARLCADVDVPVHELRLHPYLFPVGLCGAPTFSGDGDPAREARVFWKQIRRALLRKPADRIGLGGYLHLVENYPDFADYIEQAAAEFRNIKALHRAGPVYTLPLKAAVLHGWGRLRSWTLSGHFHETDMHDLIHLNEALSGLPVDVIFLDFEEVKSGALKEVDVVINAGRAGTVWSGGDAWKDEILVAALQQWVNEGGVFIGVNEPAAAEGFNRYFRMGQVLGIDEDTGARVCHGKWTFTKTEIPGLIPAGAGIKAKENRYLTNPGVRVLMAEGEQPALTVHPVGRGKGIYLSEFKLTAENTRLLLNLMLYGKNLSLTPDYVSDNPRVECAYYPAGKTLIAVNNHEVCQRARVKTEGGRIEVVLEGYEMKIINLSSGREDETHDCF